MSTKAAITVNRPRDEVERLWRESDHTGAGTPTFTDAPGDRGTEIRIEVEQDGRLREIVQKVQGTEPYATAMDALRRFKQRVETGEIARSDATPDGERLEHKPSQRPAQPLEEASA